VNGAQEGAVVNHVARSSHCKRSGVVGSPLDFGFCIFECRVAVVSIRFRVLMVVNIKITVLWDYDVSNHMASCHTRLIGCNVQYFQL
jgi:hypothetical protein